MIHFEGKTYRIRFIDHTKERIKSLLGTRSADDPAKAILGNHPGTLCTVYECTREYSDVTLGFSPWRYMMVGHGVSKVFQGHNPDRLIMSSLYTGGVQEERLPPDTYKKSEGHPRSLKNALEAMGLTRQQRMVFFRAWHGIYGDPGPALG